MSVLGNSQLLMTPEGYQISRSVRLRSSASAYLSRTLSGSGSLTTWTWSAWVKRGTLGASQALFSAGTNGVTYHDIYINSDDTLRFIADVSGTPLKYSTQVLRDPSAWYHIVAVWDTTNATADDRMRLYVNGTRITAFSSSTNPTSSQSGLINSSSYSHSIGQRILSGSNYFDGYLTEINFINGQALTPSSFGETDAITGVWKPKKYGGTYGTNGFYLNFSDNSAATAAAIGKDSSGNGNNWTPNNISVTAGTTYDSMIDTPTPYADGGNGRGNYAVFNPVNVSGGGSTITDGNLACSAGSTTTYGKILGSIGMSTGKWYWEVTITAVGSLALVGVGDGTPPNGSTGLGGAAGELAYFSNGNKYTNAVSSAYGATYTTNNVIGVAYDADAGSITFYKDNVSQGAITGLSGTKYPAVGSGGGTNPQYAVNFGQRPFAYTPPTGYVALNTFNLPTPTIGNGANYMAASTYTGTGATQTIANSGNNAASISFKPDLVWIKSRSAATNNNLFDSVRGTTNYLISNSTAAEATNANTLTAFGTTGFTLGSDASALGVNVNAATYVAWQWQAGQGTTSSNTSGSITSTVSVNTTAGFSVVTYTGTGSAGTVGHGLGVTPSMIIVKERSAVRFWFVNHTSISATQNLYLNTTDSVQSDGVFTSRSSTTFGVGSGVGTNESGGTYVAYCWSEVAGFSKFGSYTGNGSTSADGPFVYCGFAPRFIMGKRSDSTGGWWMFDTARQTYNLLDDYLYANTSDAEQSNITTLNIDVLSNGFKVRSGTSPSTWINANGGTYIFAAFAENPFKNSLAR